MSLGQNVLSPADLVKSLRYHAANALYRDERVVFSQAADFIEAQAAAAAEAEEPADVAAGGPSAGDDNGAANAMGH